MHWVIESILRVFATLLPKVHWLLTAQLVEECVPPPLPPNAVVFNCVDLGFHSVVDYLDFTLTHFTSLPVWRHSRFAALDMSNATTYARHHSCNINYFLFPLILAVGAALMFTACQSTSHLIVRMERRWNYVAPVAQLRTAGAA
jgi:hypothetical protein